MNDKRAQAQHTTDDGWDVRVEHALTTKDGTGTKRNVWGWSIRSTTDAAEWQPVRQWTGFDLTSAMDAGDPDPIAALCTLGSFLDDYADVRVLDPHDTDALFYGLPQDVARSIAQAIMAEYPDPESLPCEGCYAEPGEPCRPGCLSAEVTTCDCPCHDTDVEPWASHAPAECVCAFTDGLVAP